MEKKATNIENATMFRGFTPMLGVAVAAENFEALAGALRQVANSNDLRLQVALSHIADDMDMYVGTLKTAVGNIIKEGDPEFFESFAESLDKGVDPIELARKMTQITMECLAEKSVREASGTRQ